MTGFEGKHWSYKGSFFALELGKGGVHLYHGLRFHFCTLACGPVWYVQLRHKNARRPVRSGDAGCTRIWVIGGSGCMYYASEKFKVHGTTVFDGSRWYLDVVGDGDRIPLSVCFNGALISCIAFLRRRFGRVSAGNACSGYESH